MIVLYCSDATMFVTSIMYFFYTGFYCAVSLFHQSIKTTKLCVGVVVCSSTILDCIVECPCVQYKLRVVIARDSENPQIC